MRYFIWFYLVIAMGVCLSGQTPYPPLDSLSIEQVIQGKREVRWNTDYHRDSLDHYQPMKAVRMRDIIRQTGRWYATDNDTVATVFSLDTVYFQGLGGVGVTVVPGQWDTIKIDGSGVLGTSWWLSDGTDKPAILADTVLVVGEGCVTVDVIPGGLQDTLKITCLNPDGSETIVTAGTGISVTGIGTAGNPYVVTNTGDLSSSNEIQTLTATGAGPTNYNLNLSLGGGDVTLQEGANIDLTRSGNTITIAVVPDGDGSSTNEIQVLSAGGAGPTSYTLDLTLGGGTVTLLEGTGIDLTRSGNTITITSTVVDTDTDDQFLTLTGTGPNYTIDIDNGSDIIVAPGTGISLSESPANTLIITNTGDLSNTNEIQTLTATGAGPTSYNINLNLGGGDVTLLEGTGIDLTRTGNTITIASTIVDTDTDDQFLTLTGAGPTYTIDIDNGTDIIVSPGTGISLSESPANTLVITNTGDLSNTNELQTLSNSSDATSHTTTLSNSGGSVKFVEGSSITLTTTGTVLDGIVTIAVVPDGDGSSTNEIQNLTIGGVGPNYSIDIDLGGTDVTIAAGTGISLSESPANTLIITNTGDNDSNPLNEAWTIDADDADTEVISTQTVKFEGAGGITTDYVPATDKLIITGTVPTGAETIVTAGTGISVTGIGTSGNPYIVSNTGDLSNTNEIQTLSAGGAGPTNYTLDLTLGGGTVTLQEGASIDLTRTGNTITIAVIADGDGSSTNEIQNLTIGGTGPNYSIDIDLGGTDVIVAAGTGISLSESPANTLIITNSGDLSNTNEIQTLSAGGAGPTDYTIDLTSSATSVTLSEGTGINLTRTGNTITIAWTGTTLNGIYGDGTPGSGSSFLPPGGSVVDVTDDDPLIFDLNNGSGQSNRMMRFQMDYSSDDALTEVLAIVTPHDSLKFESFDRGIQLQYRGQEGYGRGLEIISTTQLHLDADSIRSLSASILNKSQMNYLAGYYGPTELTYSKIAGTTNGQIMKWNSAGYWELGTDNAGGSGTVTGTGTATQLAWWNGASSLSSDAAAYWDNTNKRMGIGAGTTPSSSLDVTKTALGTSQTTTSGIALVNTTAAAVNAQQISPALRWSGNGWKTTATAASQPVEFRSYVTPVQGTTAPSGYLGFGSAINSSWTNDQWNFNSNGEVGFGMNSFSGAGTFGRLNVTGSSGDFGPFLLNLYSASSSGGVVYGQIANTQTASTVVFSLNEVANINTVNAGIRRYGSTHATRANELEIFNNPSASLTMSTNSGVTRWTLNNVGTVFQPGKLGAGQSTAAAVTSTLQTNSFGVAYLETVGAPTFDDTKHTVVYTASTNISWTIPTAAGCACAGRIYVLHHAGTAGVITLSNSVTKGNGGNFNTLNAGEWAYIIYGSSSIRGYKITSL